MYVTDTHMSTFRPRSARTGIPHFRSSKLVFFSPYLLSEFYFPPNLSVSDMVIWSKMGGTNVYCDGKKPRRQRQATRRLAAREKEAQQD